MEKKIKLDDVARLAGVSKATASRVLNHRGYLSQKTIDKVHQAMEDLNYRPNAIARQLYKQETMLVGLIFPTINNPYFAQLEAALEKCLYNEGYRAVMGNSENNAKKEENYLQLLLDRQLDGLIVGAHNPEIPAYHKTSLPIVSIERVVSNQVPVVSVDNYEGGRLATNACSTTAVNISFTPTTRGLCLAKPGPGERLPRLNEPKRPAGDCLPGALR